MMFEKNNTNFSGENLCDSCRFAITDPIEGIITNCSRTGEWVHNVGVCKDYEDFRTSDNDKA